MNERDHVSIGVYLPRALWARWKAIADLEDRPVSYVMRRALKASIDSAEREARAQRAAADGGEG